MNRKGGGYQETKKAALKNRAGKWIIQGSSPGYWT